MDSLKLGIKEWHPDKYRISFHPDVIHQQTFACIQDIHHHFSIVHLCIEDNIRPILPVQAGLPDIRIVRKLLLSNRLKRKQQGNRQDSYSLSKCSHNFYKYYTTNLVDKYS